MIKYLFILICCTSIIDKGEQEKLLFKVTEGFVQFTSDAPLELIVGKSNELKGLLNLTKKTFAFSIDISTFGNFNSALQREHFNEHYMESERYPKATFLGHLVGYDCIDSCEQDIFAKGKIDIHGISKIMTIPVNIKKKLNVITAKSNFTVLISDFDIDIPKILQAKIAPEISVEINAKFVERQ